MSKDVVGSSPTTPQNIIKLFLVYNKILFIFAYINSIMEKKVIQNFKCIYVYRTGKKVHECIFKAYTLEDAKTHFNFFYPKRILKNIELDK